MMHVISLGAGVQSTTMALMAAHGEITPMPDCAIFADTGWEPKAVYDHLAWLQGLTLPFPIHIVSTGRNLRDDVLRASRHEGRFVAVPFFTVNGGLGRRQCTREFKIDPIAKKQRELLGYRPRQSIPDNMVTCWIGISLDEAIRAKPSWYNWQTNRWPLIEQALHRRDCLAWLNERGYPQPPKSSCIGCPYHDNAHWRHMRDHSPDEFAEAIRIDKALRERGPMKGMRVQQYMHRDLVPLDKVDLRTDAELGQLDLFLNECEGMCGV
jgi:hypothetical protein